MERIRQKIGRINEYLSIIDKIKHECRHRFHVDPVYRGAMLHYLYLVADTCIVLAEMVIKTRNLRIPQTYSESFEILGENGVLDPDFAYSFAKIAAFRNFLAHDYEKVDAEAICGDILESLSDVRTYISQISQSFGIENAK